MQGAWGNLRDAVVDNFGFPDSDKLMFHINEAMSWESVRNLKQMKSTLLIVQNIAVQGKAPEDVAELIKKSARTISISSAMLARE